ncbi:MAG TPA: DUF2163 domain-containing protein [Candidatus Angelobacter sp.]|nr:DUF2163 domain-containing protein [Candidatus Angelobacter sp.]
MKTPTNIDTPVANLLQFSEQFDHPVWAKDSANGPPPATVTPNSQADPLNGLTADTINFGATNIGQWALLTQSFLDVATVAGKTFTFSIWLKAASSVQLNLCIEDTGGHVAVSTNVNVTTAWSRFMVTGTFPSSGLAGTPIVFFGNDGVMPASTVYAWGAQVENNSTATAYASTTTPAGVQHNNLVTWLQTATEIRMADLYTVTLKSGTTLRYTTWDTNLVVLGNTFLTGPPNIERSAIEEKIGMDVATLELTIEASLSDLVNDVPIFQAIGQGLFDGAGFRIDRLFLDSNSNQTGTVVRFSGFIGQVEELTRSTAKLTVNAATAYLNMQLPSILLQPGCTNTLFDPRCGLLKTSFADNLTVQAGSTVNKLITTSGRPDTYFDNGQLIFTSGANNGLVKAIRQFIGGVIFFNSPLPFVPNAGDAFTAYPGCDKTQTTCTAKFNNLANFEGYPYVPAPETAI